MYLTTPKQYLRKEIIALRNLGRKLKAMDAKAGKGTIGQNIRTFVLYHFVMPLIFQYVSLGLPGVLRPFRDDDDEDLIRAAVLGNLNALFILGEMITYFADVYQRKPWSGQVPALPFYDRVAKPIGDLFSALAIVDPVKRAEAIQKLYWICLNLQVLQFQPLKDGLKMSRKL